MMCSWRETARDHSTYSNYDKVVVKHYDFDWKVDFESTTIAGAVTLTVETVVGGVDKVVLDSRDLHVGTATVDGTTASVDVGSSSEAFGSALTISIPAALQSAEAKKTYTIRIEYRTDPKCTALAWLPKEQTDGGEHPYLFSQCQAIHARSLFPCMDSPGVRATYSATVAVPNTLQALMSGLLQDTKEEGGIKVSKFNQPVPISCYLVAIVVGNVVKQDISERVAVWSEAKNLKLAAHDFGDTEKFVACGEDLVGPYVWTRYDVVCLPGSFPYGGMENPCLTFVTPSLLTGDKALADVICHEVAHSWTGNLVGPETWEDFYLNEGFTMFLQRKIMSRIHQPEYFNFDAHLGLAHLKDDVDRYGHDHPYTALRPDLEGIDPDDAFSSVPYEKGFCFIVYLEGLVNAAAGEHSFDKWLHSYIQTYKYRAITTKDMLGYLHDYYKDNAAVSAELAKVDYKSWLDTPGMPLVPPKFPSPLTDACLALAAKWNAGASDASGSDLEGWSTAQVCLFLNNIDDEKMTDAMVAKMNTLYGFCASKNSEVLFLFLKLCISRSVTSVDYHAVLDDFLSRIGRMKFTRPLYRALKAADEAKAQATFKKYEHRYHSICQKMVGKDLGLC